MILLDAKRGSGDIPTIAGYDNLAGFTDTPLLVDTTQPNWSFTQKGIFFDAMGSDLLNISTQANFGELNASNEAAFLNSDYWYGSVNGKSGVSTSRETAVRFSYRHQYGINKLIGSVKVKIETEKPTTTATAHSGRVYLEVIGGDGSRPEGFVEFNNTTIGEHVTVTVDTSSLIVGEVYDINIDVFAKVEYFQAESSFNAHVTRAFMSEHPVVRTGT
jgi:hypothetical protein